MDYYGDMPYSEELYHYGVKGMRWGVRKAINKMPVGAKTSKKLDKLYKKANRKLQKLNYMADVSIQKKNAEKWKKVAKVGSSIAGISALGIGHHSASINHLPYGNQHIEFHGTNIAGEPVHLVINDPRKHQIAKGISAVVGSAGLGTAIGAGIKYKKAKNLATYKGHAKAVAKRNEWRNQMAENFKGTKYAKLPGMQKKRKKR